MMKNKFKKILISGSAAVLCAGFICAQSASIPVSENSLYNEITSADNTGFYPGVIQKAEDFEKAYPQSPYIADVKLKKAAALNSTNQFESTIEELSGLLEKLPADSENSSEAYYFLGHAYYGLNDYKPALKCFYNSAKLTKNNKSEIYNQSVLYGGRINFILNAYGDAADCFEYVVSKGNLYKTADFEEGLQKLIICWNNSGNSKKSEELFVQLKEEDFEPEFYWTTAIYGAQAYENSGEYEKAYNLYCSVVEKGIKNLSIIGLKKAYILAEKKKVSVNPGEILSRNSSFFENQPEMICDFWIRLGIDEFEKGNYQKEAEYFENARKLILEASVPGDIALVYLYEGKTSLLTETDSSKLLAAKKTLESNKSVFEKSETENIMDSYYSTLIQFDGVLESWQEALKNFQSMKNPDGKAAYCAAVFYYRKNDFQNCTKLLEPFLKNEECKKLYASCCLKAGNAGKAAELYSQLENPDSKTLLEYSKALFELKRYSLALEKSQKCGIPEGNYIAGLCQINLQNWNEARNCFNQYIKQSSSKKDFIGLAFFYKGYAEYCLGEFKNSYSSFVRFTSAGDPAGDAAGSGNNGRSYIVKACDFAVKSALQNKDFTNAALYAEKLVKVSETKEEKQQAVLLNAQIYSDSGNYEKAVQTLLPYTNENSDFALQAMMETGKIYEKQGNIEASENYMEKIISKAPKSSWAEEALYHEGEIYYSVKDYSTAENRFNKYVYKYAEGRFGDGALFFCADCNLRLGGYEKAIMLSEVFINRYKASPFAYGMYTNLMEAYYQEQDYENALSAARTIIAQFPEQAADAGIGKKASELSKLVSGSDRQITVKLAEYERLGKTGSREGRDCGTQLVRLYLKSDMEQKAFDLACELVKAQEKASAEKENYGENLTVIADYYRKNNENDSAAQNYLNAALAFRSAGKGEKAAQSLYSAADAFKAAGLAADAEETGETLKSLYPDSEYAAAVERITGQ